MNTINKLVNQLFIVVFSICFLTACATTQPTVVDTSCSWVNPIFISKQDKLTQKTASAILSHDDKWEQICGGKK